MRWPAMVGAACLAVMAVLYHDAPTNARAPDPQGSTARRRIEVLDSLRLLTRSIDSIELRSGGARRLISLGRRSPGLSVVEQVDSGAFRAVPDSIGRIVDAAWARQPARDPSINVLIRISDGWASLHTILPSALDGATCVRTDWAYGTMTAQDAEYSLGGCGYYAAFGRPGPDVERWFTTSAIGFRTGPPGWSPVPDPTDWVPQQKVVWSDGGWALRLVRGGIPTPYAFSTRLAKCVANVSGACADAALRPITAQRPWEMSYFAPVAEIGAMETVLLPDLVHDFGPDRFRTFWRSPDAVPVAFERAFGVSLDAWVRGEAIAYYGPLELGAGNVGRAAVSVLVWALVFLGLTALIARRLRY